MSSSNQSQNLPTITTEDTDSPAKVVSEGESSEHTDGESDADVLKSRQFVYKELLATEKVYIDDLKTVLHVSKHFHNVVIFDSDFFVPCSELLRCHGSRGVHQHSPQTQGQERHCLWKSTRDL